MKPAWRQVRLDEIASISAGNSAPQAEALFKDGTHSFFRTSDVGKVHVGTLDDSEDKLNDKGIRGLRLYPAGTILMPKSGASTFLDHRVVMARDGYVSSHLATIQAKPGTVDPKFLFYALLTVEARSIAPDASYPTLSLSDISAIDLALPDLETQRRIVAILDEAFEAIATVENLTEQKHGALEEMVPAYVKRVLANEIGEWVETTLGQICELYQPKTISAKDLVTDGPYIVYGANGPIGRYDKYNHEEPQLLVTCRGATCGTVNVSTPKAWITGNAMVVRPRDNKLDLQFLEFLLRNAVDMAAAITGSAQPQITRTTLSPLKFRFPLSLDVQRGLARAFYSGLKNTILGNAFEGRGDTNLSARVAAE